MTAAPHAPVGSGPSGALRLGRAGRAGPGPVLGPSSGAAQLLVLLGPQRPVPPSPSFLSWPPVSQPLPFSPQWACSRVATSPGSRPGTLHCQTQPTAQARASGLQVTPAARLSRPPRLPAASRPPPLVLIPAPLGTSGRAGPEGRSPTSAVSSLPARQCLTFRRASRILDRPSCILRSLDGAQV